MQPKQIFIIAALCVAGSTLNVIAQDDVFVAQDGLNTGSIGAYSISFGAGSATGSTINSRLITSPAAGQSTEVRMTLATDGSDLFVGEYSGGTTATIGEYSLNGTAINSSFLTLSDNSDVAPQLAADGQGHLFVAVGNTVSEYNASGSLLNSFSLGAGSGLASIMGLAVDGSDDLYTDSTTGNPLQGQPYDGVIGEYTASGTAISKSLITTPNFINGLSVGGGDIYTSIQDGPPDVVNRVDEYTTGGSTVKSPLIFGMGGHTALDGQGHLLVDSYGDGTVSAYTTSGTLIGSGVVSGANAAEDIIVIPVPEPSVAGLMAVGVLGLLVRRRK